MTAHHSPDLHLPRNPSHLTRSKLQRVHRRPNESLVRRDIHQKQLQSTQIPAASLAEARPFRFYS